MRCIDVECAVAKLFNIRTHLIVPNISWGLLNHEADLLIVNKAGFAIEVEIKVSKSDFLADFKKRKHKRNSMLIKGFYYAIPDYLQEKCEALVPENAGLIVVKQLPYGKHARIIKKCPPKPVNNFRKLTDREIYQVARLGTMRIFPLKHAILNYRADIQRLKNVKNEQNNKHKETA